MTNKTLVLYYAICAYEDNGIARFCYNNLDWYGSKNTIANNIKILEKENLLEKININGTYSRYRIFNPVNCPRFIFKDFTLMYKAILLQVYLRLNNLPEKITKTYLCEKCNISWGSVNKYFSNSILQDILDNNDYVKINISEDSKLHNIEGDLIYYNKSILYKCQDCGTTNPENFYKNSHILCKKCKENRKKLKLTQDIASKLYYNSTKSFNAKNHIQEYNLTKEYIQEILENQNYKCAYTGVELKIGNKLTNPTIDRIDSSKGYIKGNIVICTEFANTAKNDLTLDEFKNQINLLYNTLIKNKPQGAI